MVELSGDRPDQAQDPAAPHEPPYAYEQHGGYKLNAINDSHEPSNNVAQGQDINYQAALDDENDLYDSEDESDLFDDDFSSSNPKDYTKSYNRQRRLHDVEASSSQLPRTNPQQKPKANMAVLIDDQITALARHAGKLKLDDQAAGLKSGGGNLGQERSDRATSEQVLDPRTRMILLQMINRGIVSEIHGCISTGKEANVYHAIRELDTHDGTPKHLAVKIYKTAILHFKDRSKYVSGEFRFQRGFAKKSSRGMVRLWAEKEFRNLRRIYNAGIPVPQPVYLKSHVLVMDFVGSVTSTNRPTAAPLLRDIEFQGQSEDQQVAQWSRLYRETVSNMRIMYQTCKLVHADLSEFNMLYDQDDAKLTVIDVSQSVEHDHPRSLDFLRTDIKNVTRFFARKTPDTISEPSMFHFIARDKSFKGPEDIQRTLNDLKKHPIQPDADDEVFRQQYIPQNLNQIGDDENKRFGNRAGNEADESALQDLIACKDSNATNGDEGADQHSYPSSADSDSSEIVKTPREPGLPRGHRFENRAEKAQRKAAVKEAKRQRRATKMPKHVKRKLVSNSSRGHKN